MLDFLILLCFEQTIYSFFKKFDAHFETSESYVHAQAKKISLINTVGEENVPVSRKCR